MTGYAFLLGGQAMEARASGALWWPDEALLIVSDLHMGRSARIARRGGTLLPPYETADTLARLDAELAALAPRTVICLGDSFDDLAAADLPEAEAMWLARLMAGRRWIWIEGNHDPGPVALGGTHLAMLRHAGVALRHIAQEAEPAPEISGHYHPKARLAGGGPARPCFLISPGRVILPAFGTYTGGMDCNDPVLAALMPAASLAVLTGPRAIAMPMRASSARRPARVLRPRPPRRSPEPGR